MSLITRWNDLRPDRLTTHWLNGIVAGAAGAFTVLAVFALDDWRRGALLSTPRALGNLLLEGPRAPVPPPAELSSVLVYTAVHFGLWVLIGLTGASCLAQSRFRPRMWYVAVLLPAVFCIALLMLEALWEPPGVERWTLVVGGLLGGVAASTVLLWRYPDQLHHLE